MTSVIKIQQLFRTWKTAQDGMITQITSIWVEERDRIIAHCLKKSSKQKKLLQKKVQQTPPVVMIQIIR